MSTRKKKMARKLTQDWKKYLAYGSLALLCNQLDSIDKF